MKIDRAIKNQLTSTAAVTALLGRRIFPVIAPASTKTPFAVYTLVSEIAEHALSGDASEVSALYQVSVFDEHYNDAKAAADVIRAVLQNFSGTMGGGGGIAVGRSFFVQETNGGYDPTGKQLQVILEFDFKYTRV